MQDSGEDQVLLYLNATSGSALKISLARQGVNEYQYRFQLQHSSGALYTHTASADPLATSDARTVLFRFDAENYEIFVEEVSGSTGARFDKTGDSTNFTTQVRCIRNFRGCFCTI